jgi:hypothetical protein
VHGVEEAKSTSTTGLVLLMRDRLPAPPAIHHYPVMPDMSVESDERMDESQVIYFVAPMALSIAFCLCFIRIVITGCMRLGRRRIHPPSSGRRVTAEGMAGGGVSVVQPNTTSCGLMGRGEWWLASEESHLDSIPSI